MNIFTRLNDNTAQGLIKGDESVKSLVVESAAAGTTSKIQEINLKNQINESQFWTSEYCYNVIACVFTSKCLNTSSLVVLQQNSDNKAGVLFCVFYYVLFYLSMDFNLIVMLVFYQ